MYEAILKIATETDLRKLLVRLEEAKKYVKLFPIEITFYNEKFVFENEPEIFDFQTNIKAQLGKTFRV
jgi:hypothetical protein